MTQPTFAEFNQQERREKIRRRVRAVSIQQYADGRERFTGRKANVLRWLAAYYNCFQVWPTSAELAAQQAIDVRIGQIHIGPAVGTWDHTAGLLYVRRGLSDLQTVGVVEANGPRACRVAGRVCETWRVVPVGR